MKLINYEDAMAIVKSELDVGLQQFMARAVNSAVRQSAEGGTPAGEFDMLFFLKIITDLHRQKQNLVRVFSGEDLRWWTEEE
jgi:hypothetical protein